MARGQGWTRFVVLAVALSLWAIGPGPVVESTPTFSACTSDNVFSSDTVVSIADFLSPQQVCCKVCHQGQACGNSCISKALTCHQPPGCACNG